MDTAFEFVAVRDKGKLDTERILLKCLHTRNIGATLILIGKRVDEKSVTPDRKNVFWLPDIDVQEGEFVRIYTKEGVNNKTIGKFGEEPATYHNLYWGKSSTMWDVTNNVVIIMALEEWKMYDVK